MEEPLKICKKNVYDEAGFFSRLTFWWIVPLFNKGWSEELSHKDFYTCSKEDDPKFWADALEREWQKELEAHPLKVTGDGESSTSSKPAVARALVRTFASTFLKTSPLIWGVECFFRLIQPFLIAVVVNYLTSGDESLGSKARICVAGIVVINVVLTFMIHHGFSKHARHGNNARSALTHLIYKKLLKLHKSAFETTDIGQILNILANDLNRFEELGWLMVYLFVGPAGCVVTLIGTYKFLGYSSLAGFVILLLFIPFQGFMGRLFSKFRRDTTEITDKRVNLMTELISAMKLIKVYCWEYPFASEVKKIREQEIREMRNTYFLEGVNSAFFYVAAKIMLFACFVTYVLAEQRPLTAEMVFFTMSIYNALRVPATRIFPNAVGLTGESWVALERVTAILLLEERPDTSSQENCNLPDGSIALTNFSGKWTKKQTFDTLDNISLKVNPGELVIVIGAVGSGKTCLLYSLLNEIENTAGSCLIGGSISYAPQESWCFGGSVKQNILLGSEFDEARYKEVIRVTGLQRDIELFESGDETFVGEKGHNLSGGQKARVTLARAAYAKSATYLLDDPLSAVDPKIANHIFKHCIKNFLAGKTVVLVTHQLQFLPQADKIVMMKDGRVVDCGSYNELISRCVDFHKQLDRQRKEQERKDSVTKQRSLSLKKESELEASKSGEEQNSPSNIASPDRADSREETKILGSVSIKVFWRYFRSGGSIFFILFTLTVSVVAQALYHFSDMWLAAWTQEAATSPSSYSNSSNKSVNTSSLPQEHLPWAHGQVLDGVNNNVILYAILMSLLFITVFIRMLVCFFLCLKCSINLHTVTFQRILRAPLSFFESNPLGRILNRFTRDIGIVDVLIPRSTIELNMTILEVIGSVLVTCVISNIMIVPTVVIAILSYPVREYYVRTARDIHRLDAIFRSPVYHHLTATFDGLITIRAFKIEQRCEEQYIRYLRDSTACRFLVFYAIRLLGMILDGFSNIYILCVCLVLTETPREGIAGGDAGLILAQSLTLIGIFQYCIRMTSEFENQMTSTERVLEYSKLQPEAELRIPGKVEDENWPSKGNIVFKNVSLRYSRDSEPVLREITFKVRAGEKVGIVGRTGAGKSSLISVLFRLVEPEGQVLIDGVDIKSLGLHELRSKISIIPQDPSLFSGKVRNNLDPFGKYSDSEILLALDEAHLRATIENMQGKLDANVNEGGSNLSVGQRQLLCLARALLKKNRILVMDEATANVDLETDKLIQRTIKNTFKEYTVLTVAHRLDTIIDMDKVLVMDAGRVVEFDAPHLLLQDKTGLFYSMVKQTGPGFEQQLHSLAARAYLERGESLNKN